ncbi:hypothetical protein AA14337_0279 [Acetobacter malorum DSM 14337]|uniref:Uncharacterized protein n=1 Tax=Acetobacter malorum DSM 14337 TaxID=1307910 RepID=A0ABQ0PMV8_9PROT|nr:hypothetical protein AA14337_0279 [Acetobacter malorum DSM 14337]
MIKGRCPQPAVSPSASTICVKNGSDSAEHRDMTEETGLRSGDLDKDAGMGKKNVLISKQETILPGTVYLTI